MAYRSNGIFVAMRMGELDETSTNRIFRFSPIAIIVMSPIGGATTERTVSPRNYETEIAAVIRAKGTGDRQ
jgi:hypothetical protein